MAKQLIKPSQRYKNQAINERDFTKKQLDDKLEELAELGEGIVLIQNLCQAVLNKRRKSFWTRAKERIAYELDKSF